MSCRGCGGSKSPSGVEGRSPGRTSEGRSTPESEAFNEFYRILKMPNEFYFEIYYFNFDWKIATTPHHSHGNTQQWRVHDVTAAVDETPTYRAVQNLKICRRKRVIFCTSQHCGTDFCWILNVQVLSSRSVALIVSCQRWCFKSNPIYFAQNTSRLNAASGKSGLNRTLTVSDQLDWQLSFRAQQQSLLIESSHGTSRC